MKSLLITLIAYATVIISLFAVVIHQLFGMLGLIIYLVIAALSYLPAAISAWRQYKADRVYEE